MTTAMMMMAAPTPLKILVVGAPGVGKSTLIRRWTNKSYCSTYTPTIGIQVTRGSHDDDVLIDFWELSHPELHNPSSVLTSDVDGVFFVFNVDRVSSLVAVDQWYTKLSPSTTAKFILLGHKADLVLSSRVISSDDINAYVTEAKYISWYWTVGRSTLGESTDAPSVLLALRQMISECSTSTSNTTCAIHKAPIFPKVVIPLLPLTSSSTNHHSNVLAERFSLNTSTNEEEEDIGWKYFIGSVSREMTERILLENGNDVNTFVIRRKDPTTLVLSYVKTPSECNHILITYKNGMYVISTKSSKKCFDQLGFLVNSLKLLHGLENKNYRDHHSLNSFR